MPKRSNPFQQVIHAIYKQLSEDAIVTESKMVRDRQTGAECEVDIVIERHLGPHLITVSVECTSEKRRASVEWVREMVGKHKDLATDKLILVAKSGFTRQALDKARKEGIETLTFAEAERTDWAKVAGALPRVYLALPEMRPTQVAVHSAIGSLILGPDTPLFNGDKGSHSTLNEIAMAALRTNLVLEFVFKTFEKPGDYSFLLGYNPPEGSFVVDVTGGKYRVDKIEFRVGVHLGERVPVDLEHHAYGNAQVAYGTFAAADLEALLTVVEVPERSLSADVRVLRSSSIH